MSVDEEENEFSEISTADNNEEAVEIKEQTYCICNSIDDGSFMICCDSCNEWFHGDCVNISAYQAKHIAQYYCLQCRENNSNLTLVYKQPAEVVSPLKRKSYPTGLTEEDKERLRIPLQKGWVRAVIERWSGEISRDGFRHRDVYYYYPGGEPKFRSLLEVASFLDENQVQDLNVDHFYFGPLLVGGPNETTDRNTLYTLIKKKKRIKLLKNNVSQEESIFNSSLANTLLTDGFMNTTKRFEDSQSMTPKSLPKKKRRIVQVPLSMVSSPSVVDPPVKKRILFVKHYDGKKTNNTLIDARGSLTQALTIRKRGRPKKFSCCPNSVSPAVQSKWQPKWHAQKPFTVSWLKKKLGRAFKSSSAAKLLLVKKKYLDPEAVAKRDRRILEAISAVTSCCPGENKDKRQQIDRSEVQESNLNEFVPDVSFISVETITLDDDDDVTTPSLDSVIASTDTVVNVDYQQRSKINEVLFKLTCDYCQGTWTSLDSLKAHMLENHADGFCPYYCTLCNYQDPNPRRVRDHCRFEHKNPMVLKKNKPTEEQTLLLIRLRDNLAKKDVVLDISRYGILV